MKHCNWQKKKQSLLATLWLHVRLGSGVVPIELHCGDVLMTNFDPVNFCPFDTFLRNTLVQINSKLNSKSHDNSTYTNTVFWQKRLHYRLQYKQKQTPLTADSALLDGSS